VAIVHQFLFQAFEDQHFRNSKTSPKLGLMSPEAAADEAEKLLAGGFLSVKLRLGHPNLEQDLAVTRAVRKRLPDAIELPGAA
jgi:L-alanine-DL-glutamate epimerase-like enolase superfamily enzyme